MIPKKYMQFLLTTLLVIILFFLSSFRIQAEVICTEWDDGITKTWEQQNWYQFERNDIGIFYDFTWEKEEKKIKIKRDINRYPVVRFSLFNKTDISQGSIVKLYNDIDLSKKSDLEIKQMHRNSENVKLELLSGKNINITSKPYKFNDIKLESFGLQTIYKIEPTKGTIEIAFDSIFSSIRPDLLKIFKQKDLYIEDGFSNLCNQTIDENEFPIESFYFDEFKYDEDLRKGLENKTKINTPIMSLSIDNGKIRVFRQESGISFYRQDFQFEKFPFDKQKIQIIILTGMGNYSQDYHGNEAAVTFITPKKGAFLNLEDLKMNNFLKEWEIISTNIVSNEIINENYYDAYSEKITKDSMNSIILEIEIERNFEQYIYKIIIPVFLILSLAWFVLWIPTKEFESRLTTSMVALLSLIAYNFVFVDDVPKLNYLTALDEYILLSYIFCCIPTFMSIWFSRFISTNQKKATFINRKIRIWGIAFYIIASLWIFFPK